MPKRLTVEEEREESEFYYGKYSFSPMERGFATTLGNSLRRVLLSSIMSLAVTRIKIPDKYHEYDTVPGVKEDILEMIMSIKQIQLRKEISMEEVVELKIEKDGPCVVKAKDIICPAGISITNPELKIATINEGGKLELFMYAEVGKGYIPVSEQEKTDDIQIIPIDGIFTPVVRVNFRQENIRVGKKTDYDKLILEIWTKKNLSPSEALRMASKILIEHFGIILENLPEFKGVEMVFDNNVETKTDYERAKAEKDEAIFAEDEEESSDALEKETGEGMESESEEEESFEDEESEESEKSVDSGEGDPEAEIDVNEQPIEVLELSKRSLHCLKREKIETIGQLLNVKISELLKIRNFGQKSLDEVSEKLKEKFGIDLES